jgi:hypothetical protein
MRTHFFYPIAASILSVANNAYAGNSCWNWYGQIKCSLDSGGTLPLYKLDPDYIKNRCKQSPYLAEHSWKDCEPYLKEILEEQNKSSIKSQPLIIPALEFL